MNDTVRNILNKFKQDSMLNKLIYINLAVFILIKLIDIVFMLFGINISNPFINWFSAYANIKNCITHPWGVVTYMFVHEDFLHILFNLLWLYWFGRIFSEYFNHRQLMNLYLGGGIAGALLFILIYNLSPTLNESTAIAIGASAAIYAIVLATAVYVPNYTVYLMFLGQVKIKWIAFFAVLSDIATLNGSNTGGHIAHIGGAVFGILFIYYLKRGIDITSWIGKICDKIVVLFQPRKKMKVHYRRTKPEYEFNQRRNDQQKEIDAILEKISKSGYNGLTNEEKQILFKNSKNI